MPPAPSGVHGDTPPPTGAFKKSIFTLSILLGVLFLILFNAFCVPYLYYAAFSVGISVATPTQVVPIRTFMQMHQQETCGMSSDRCCVYLGPIIGKTTTTTTRFLIELTQSVDLQFTLTPLGPDDHPNGETTEHTAHIPARTPTVVELDGLTPRTTYTIKFNNCEYPLALQPEGGDGLIKTLPTTWELVKPKLAVVSCNSINIRNREQRRLDHDFRPQHFHIHDMVQNFTHKNNSTIENILSALNDPSTVNYLSQSTELWGSLFLETKTLDVLMHLGDQTYMDSNHDNGIENNQFLQSQTLVYEYLTHLWEYKQLYAQGNAHRAEQYKAQHLPLDTPNIAEINASFFTQPFQNLQDAFTKHPSAHHRVNNLIPQSIKQQILILYRNQYIKTFTHPPTRLTLSRVANLMIWDDHDVFDDSNDCPADTDALSLRRMIFDIGLATYHHYQHVLNRENNVVPRGEEEFYTLTTSATTTTTSTGGGVITTRAFKLSFDRKYLTPPHALPHDLLTGHPQDPAVLAQLFTPVTAGMHHFHTLPDGLCLIFLDTRSGRSPASFSPDMYSTFYEADPLSATKPYLLLGKEQWQDLEQFLYTDALSQCSALIISGSMPFVFMQSSPNFLVSIFHDDMIGHLSSQLFEREQTRLFNLFTNWREEQQLNTPQNKAQLLFLGGDVHSSGYSQVYPFLYQDHSLRDAYLYNNVKQQTFTQVNNNNKNNNDPNTNNNNNNSTTNFSEQGEVTLQDKIEPLSTLTVSPIQNEGLHIAWMTSLNGFQHSYPIISDPHDEAMLQNNGVMHTLSSTYYKVLIYAETYLAVVLPTPVLNVVKLALLGVHKVIQSIYQTFFVIFQHMKHTLGLHLDNDDNDYYYSTTGFKLQKKKTTNPDDVIVNNTTTTSQTAATDGQQIVDYRENHIDEKYYFGYHHHSWINTNAYAVIEVYPTLKDNHDHRDQVCIQSQIVTQARPHTEEDIFNLYKTYAQVMKQQEPTTQHNIYFPTLWSRYAKHNSTGHGC